MSSTPHDALPPGVTGFVGGGRASQVHQPGPQGPVYVPPARLPRPLPPPTLTVKATGEVTLSKPLMAAVGRLRPGGPVDLVPPLRRGGIWHLDTRPTAVRRIKGRLDVSRFNIPPLSREHLLFPMGAAPGQFGVTAGAAPGQRAALRFALGEEYTEPVCVTDAAGVSQCTTRGTGYFALVPVPVHGSGQR